MFAEYDGKLYGYVKTRKGAYLTTHDEGKTDDSFLPHREGLFKKKLEDGDEKLSRIFNVHFYVAYDDPALEEKEWCVDEGAPLHEVPHIEDGEVGLWTENTSVSGKEGWVRCDKYACSKIARLDDCKAFFVEKESLSNVSNGHKGGSSEKPPVKVKEREEVGRDTFAKRMVFYRWKNI